MHRKFVPTVFRHPYLFSVEPIVQPNAVFWETYFSKPATTLLVHTGYRNMPAEKRLSIDGSVYIDSCQFESPPLWDKNSDEDLEEFYERHQFGRYQRVMLYGSRGNMAACRFALLLLYMGITRINVLDGGLTACPGHEEIDASGDIKQLKESSTKMQTHKELFMTAKEAYQQVKSGSSQLVDIRSKQEHLGLISGYADYHKKGRPKGSLYGGNIDRFITEQGTKGDFNDVLKLWDQNKIDWQSKQLILFCGTGWRAAEAFIYGLDSGLPNLSVFSGIRDWIESSLPLEQH